jgi:hypothetical protein
LFLAFLLVVLVRMFSMHARCTTRARIIAANSGGEFDVCGICADGVAALLARRSPATRGRTSVLRPVVVAPRRSHHGD